MGYHKMKYFLKFLANSDLLNGLSALMDFSGYGERRQRGEIMGKLSVFQDDPLLQDQINLYNDRCRAYEKVAKIMKIPPSDADK